MQPESQPPAPAVVAVVVTCDPGPWFDQALASLAEQDYPNLSILVIDAGSDRDPTPTVAGRLPTAFVRRLGERRGFAAAANEVLTMVEGASHLLICHDDVALDPDALRLMVEEAFRSNAGITTPKYVEWDAPDRLVAVGATADVVGVLRDLVDPGELDQQQHDAVRDVLVAPGGATLIRADLFTALEGYDPAIDQFGEDLDLCWRAHVVGARVVAVPSARVRHVQAIARGERGSWTSASSRRRVASAQESNRIRTLATCYRWFDLMWVLPLALFWLLGEAVTDAVGGRPADGMRAVGSFARGFRRPVLLWRTRHRTQKARGVGDSNVRKLQAKGNTRLRVFLRQRFGGVLTVLPHGHDGHPTLTGYEDAEEEESAVEYAALLSSPEPDDRAGPTSRLNLLVVLAVLIILVFGTRNLLGAALPSVGQLPNLSGGWSSIWRSWWSGWQTQGLGSTAPSTPALALIGALATVLFGAVGVTEHVIVLAPLVIGPLGAYRAARWWGSRRGQLAALVAYAIVPLPYNALARGHWSALVAFALTPWIISAFIRISDEVPVAPTRTLRIGGRVIGAAFLVAIVASVAPAFLYVIPIVGVALLGGSALAGRPWPGVRMLAVSAAVTVVAFVLLLPWSATVIFNGSSLLGTNPGPGGRLGFGAVLRFQTGPFGNSWVGWAFLAAAALPLLVGRGWRLAWASRLWTVAIVAFIVVWAGRRGWFPDLPVEVVLAPAAAALAGSAALGVAAFELDLPGYNFGWRQLVSGAAGIALAVASLTFVLGSAGGRWKLPSADDNSVLSFLPSAAGGDYRVLWVGAPDALPLAGRQLYPGISYATSYDGPPGVADLWNPGPAGAASQLAADLDLARGDLTTKLGHLLAPASIRYIVVPNHNAPSGSGAQPEQTPNGLLAGLGLQTDLQAIDVGDTNFSVYQNSAWLPGRAVLSAGAATVAGSNSDTSRRAVQELDLSSSAAVLGGPQPTSGRGLVPAGSSVFVSATRSSAWHLDVGGASVAPVPAFGWAMDFDVPAGASGQVPAHLSFSAPWWIPTTQWIEVVVWLAALVAVVVDTRQRRRDTETPEVVDAEWFVPIAPVATNATVERRQRRARMVDDTSSEEMWSDV